MATDNFNRETIIADILQSYLIPWFPSDDLEIRESMTRETLKQLLTVAASNALDARYPMVIPTKPEDMVLTCERWSSICFLAATSSDGTSSDLQLTLHEAANQFSRLKLEIAALDARRDADVIAAHLSVENA